MTAPSSRNRARDQHEILQSAQKESYITSRFFVLLYLILVSGHWHVPAVNNNHCGQGGGFVRVSEPMITLQHPVIRATWHLAHAHTSHHSPIVHGHAVSVHHSPARCQAAPVPLPEEVRHPDPGLPAPLVDVAHGSDPGPVPVPVHVQHSLESVLMHQTNVPLIKKGVFCLNNDIHE